MTQPLHITSRDNPLLTRLRKLAHDNAAYRKTGEVWLEGEHLCRAVVARGLTIAQAVVSEAAWADPALRALTSTAERVVLLPDALFKSMSALESPPAIGMLMTLGVEPLLQPNAMTIVLDRVQDAGNVGSVLRSAAALGATQVLALQGTAALWSPKVLRAGMGAHFSLNLVESLAAEALDALRVPLLATSSHAGTMLHKQRLPSPCAWVIGHEGQGIDAALMQRCALTLHIPQPGGEESLNVAAAAAICLYESLRQAQR